LIMHHIKSSNKSHTPRKMRTHINYMTFFYAFYASYESTSSSIWVIHI